ncbi:MAG: FAD-dependent protein [Flavobacteriales bacterium]
MQKEIEITLAPHKNDIENIMRISASTLKINIERIKDIKVLKRSIDARKTKPFYRLRLTVFIDEKAPENEFAPNFKEGELGEQVIIVGAGPAGLFAGIRALELGLKPIIVDRGKDVKNRRRDLAAINKEHIVNPESNYCFGEGGAGTYSDGKLYTRSKKRGDVKKILETLVAFGADVDILADAHPHIGTNKLPQIIVAIREAIIAQGGEVQFNSKMTDLLIKNGAVEGIEINGTRKIKAEKVILATGHSARDIYYLLDRKKIAIEFKPFALGVRVEHPQNMIDKIQYKTEDRGEFLPSSSYQLVCNTKERGVFSFCMCPGGIVAPCATAPGEVVTNGWSPSKRNNPFANSGIVTEVKESDVSDFSHEGALKGLKFQEKIEQKCWEAAGKTQAVPAQRLLDFMQDRKSLDLPSSSYIPGITSVELKEVLPDFVIRNLRKAFLEFEKKMKGFLTNDAVLHAPESRTSSPVRIPRNKDTFEHIEIKGLYPCAEGAGYAGGIVSAAIDGQKCIEKMMEAKTK